MVIDREALIGMYIPISISPSLPSIPTTAVLRTRAGYSRAFHSSAIQFTRANKPRHHLFITLELSRRSPSFSRRPHQRFSSRRKPESLTKMFVRKTTEEKSSESIVLSATTLNNNPKAQLSSRHSQLSSPKHVWCPRHSTVQSKHKMTARVDLLHVESQHSEGVPTIAKTARNRSSLNTSLFDPYPLSSQLSYSIKERNVRNKGS